MPRAKSNAIEIEYDTFGDPAAEPLLLIMGLAMQMIQWDEAFCESLAERGHYVIRFDNRDVGKSTFFEESGIPNIFDVLQKSVAGEPTGAPYLLSDMAADTAGLLDALGLESAHIAGASMGGMIAQTLAFSRPEKVRSLTSIMSTTGDPSLPQPAADVQAVLLAPPPPEREANIEHSVKLWNVIGSPGYPVDPAQLRVKLAEAYDRSFYPPGAARHIAAILSGASRREALGSVTAPTLVIHGREDPLVPLAGGEDTAKHVRDAKLLIIEGMGHDMPEALFPTLVDAISDHTGAAS